MFETYLNRNPFHLSSIRNDFIWERVNKIVNFLGQTGQEESQTSGSTIRETNINISQLKLFIWYLLGIEGSLIDDKVFENAQITFSKFFKLKSLHNTVL